MQRTEGSLVRKERFQGWHTRLLGCLAMQMCRAEVHNPRNKKLLHLISHLSLKPTSGKKIHIALVGRSLLDFLSAVDWTAAVSSSCSDELLNELTELDCSASSSTHDESDDCDDPYDHRSSLRFGERMVFPSESLLHEDRDGFSQTLSDEYHRVETFDSFDLSDKTLDELELLRSCHCPVEYPLLRIVAYAVSIFSRIRCHTDRAFDLVVQNFTGLPTPDIQDTNEFRNWFVLMLLLSRGYKSLIFTDLQSGSGPHLENLSLFIQLSAHFIQSIIKSLQNGLYAELLFNATVLQTEDSFYFFVVQELLRQITDVLVVLEHVFPRPLLNASSSSRIDTSQTCSFAVKLFSLCEELGYIEIVRSAFALIENLGLAHLELCTTFFAHIQRLSNLLYDFEKCKIPCESRTFSQQVCKSFGSCSLTFGGTCALSYLFSLCGLLMSDSNSEAGMRNVLNCLQKLPRGICFCMRTDSIIETLLVETSIGSLSDDFYDTFSFHLTALEPKGDVNLTSYEMQETFIKHFSSTRFTTVKYVLRLLSLCLPYCSEECTSVILEAIVRRFCELNSSNSTDIGLQKSLVPLQLIFLEFLRENIFGDKIMALCSEKILLPVLTGDSCKIDDFSYYMALAGPVLSSDTFSCFKEDLVAALCEFATNKLALARENALDFLCSNEASRRVISALAALLQLFAADSYGDLSHSTREKIRSLCATYISLYLCCSYTKEWSRVAYCYGQICSLCFAILGYLDDSAELTKWFRGNYFCAVSFGETLQLWKHLLCGLLQSSVVTRRVKGQLSRKIVNWKLCSLAFWLLKEIVGQLDFKGSESYETFVVKSVCGEFETVCNVAGQYLDYVHESNVIADLNGFLISLSNCSCSAECFAAGLSAYSRVISVKSKPFELRPLFVLYCRCPRFQLQILEIIQCLIRNNTDGPSTSLVFPQKALPDLPIECFEAEAVESGKDVVQASEKSSAAPAASLPRPSSFLTVVERLFTFSSSEKAESYEKADSLVSKFSEGKTRRISTSHGFDELQCGAEISLSNAVELNMTTGFFVSFWFRITSSTSSMKSHLFSLPICAVSAANFSLYLNVGSDLRTIYAIVFSNKKKIYESRKRHGSNFTQWTHIVLSVFEQSEEYNFKIFLRNSRFSSLVGSFKEDGNASDIIFKFGALEDESSEKPVSYEISTVFGFKGVSDEKLSFILRCLGPDLYSLAKTKTSSLQSLFHFPLNYSTAELSTGCDFADFATGLPKSLEFLQQKFLFAIRCSSANSCSVNLLQPGVYAPPGLEIENISASLTIPKEFPVYWRCRIVHNGITTLQRCFYPLGSTRLFLYFLANAIDKQAGCEIQAVSLKLLLTYVQRGGLVRTEFSLSKGYDVITRCFSSPLAELGSSTISVIAGLSITKARDVDPYTPCSYSVIYDPEFLVNLTCCADIWRGNERIVHWIRLLKIIADCVTDAVCRFADFNRVQLCRFDFVNLLFHTCQEMLQDKENFCVPSGDSGVLVNAITAITSALIESPHATDCVLLLWNFVFLSHPAVDTYINYKIRGHVDWLKTDYMRDERSEAMNGESGLATCLRGYVRALSKERIAEVWARERSVIVLREMYADALHKDKQDLEVSRLAAELSMNGNVEHERQDAVESWSMQDTEIEEEKAAGSNDDSTGKFSADWFDNLRTGVNDILSVLAQNGPDCLVGRLFNLISWQSVVVLLTNQKDEAFRNSVFLFLEHFLLRATIKIREHFVKDCGFAILGNQLHGYPVTAQVADSLFSLCCGEPVRLEEGLDADHVQAICVDQFNCSSFDAIFVLWEESVSLETAALFWNISSAILKIFETNSLLMQAMMDAQLSDVLVGVLRKIAIIPIQQTDIENVYACSPLLDCWSSLARQVISTCISYNDSRHYEMCQRMILLMECALLEFSKLGNSTAEKKLRRGLCIVLTCWMNVLQSIFSDVGPSVSSAPSVESLNRVPAAGSGDACESVCSSSSASSKRTISPMAALVTGSLASLREKITSLGDQMKCRYKWRHQMKVPNPAEIINRVLFGMSAVSHLFTAVHPSSGSVVSEEEDGLFHYFVSFLFSTWKTDRYMNASSGLWAASSRCNAWSRVLLSCRDRALVILRQLLVYLVFPAEEKLLVMDAKLRQSRKDPSFLLQRRLLIIRMFANDILYKPMLRTLLSINLDYQCTMNLALHELAVVEKEIDEDSLRDVEKLIRFLRNLQMESPFANLSEERLLSLTSDEKLSIVSYLEHRNAYMLTMRQKASAIFDDEQIYVEQVCQLAMSVTCAVVNEQNVPRKSFIKKCRDAEIRVIGAEEVISELALQLCHPEAVCHDPLSWPLSWELDPTEGPTRERRRLTAAHLRFGKQFILPSFVHKLDNRDRPLPLSNLLSGRRTSTKEWNMVESLAPGERIKTVIPATVVRSTVESQGEVLIGDQKFYFFGNATRTTQKGILQAAVIVLAWDYAQVVEVYKRHNLLKDRALEIFFTDGQTYLIAFEDGEKRNQFLDSLLAMDLPNLINTPQNLLQSTTQHWREGSITNFEYLMQLNKLAGRTFNDLMQYPVFPFILSNYTSENINLFDLSSYRNLSKPMAVQNKDMEEHYLRNYTCLEHESKRLTQRNSTPAVFGPYHYGSHYSNSGIVVHYLVRLAPFTEIALEYQDNNFDIPDRLFNSVETTWRLSSSDSTTDFKELIPEFFYCSEFLTNREGLNLGVRQNGIRVTDVILPDWCGGSARLFIMVHRQALESSIVTATLHSWIDLIFGYKQTGLAAVQAINVFHPATYRGGISSVEVAENDLISIGALETMVRTYGQMPTQLFLSPHLPHLSARIPQLMQAKYSQGPLESVSGVRWGEFIGSPDSEFGSPVIALKQRPTRDCGHISHLHALSDGSCYAFPDKTILLPWYKSLSRSKEAATLGFLSWRYSDSVVRICLLGASPVVWKNLLDLYSFKITAFGFCSMNGLLFLALSSGVTRVYRVLFSDVGSQDCSFVRELFAHDGDVNTISICGEYAVAVTGCVRGKVCVWDTNRLSYVRTLTSRSGFSVRQSCISRTTSDIAVFLQSSSENEVLLYTVNGDMVGHVETEVAVTAMCMTTLPEGTAINCLALGLQNGIIRLLNMWTMDHVCDISDNNYMEPIVSLTFAARCTRLYSCLASGCILCWHGETMNTKRSSSLTVISANGMCQKPFFINGK